jgi:hypothetical protein
MSEVATIQSLTQDLGQLKDHIQFLKATLQSLSLGEAVANFPAQHPLTGLLKNWEDFWAIESQASLFNEEYGFLRAQGPVNLGDAAFAWINSLKLVALPTPNKANAPVPNDETANGRIFLRDAERTFKGEKNRQVLISVLDDFVSATGDDYHQGLGYVASFLLLSFDAATTLHILHTLNADPKYIPNYWKAEAIEAATDAYVFEDLLVKSNTEVQGKLASFGSALGPEVYCGKWFTGLSIHVLPFECLYHFMTGFFLFGRAYLFMFGLALVNTLSKEILAAKTQGQILELLRLDASVVTVAQCRQIIAATPDFARVVDEVDLVTLRKRMYSENLEARLNKAKAALMTRDNVETDPGEECDVCGELLPEFFCRPCKLFTCEACHKKAGPGPVTTLKGKSVAHVSTHAVEDNEGAGDESIGD